MPYAGLQCMSVAFPSRRNVHHTDDSGLLTGKRDEGFDRSGHRNY